ncbi:MAG TPA: class I SAM-dependent methyltransferase [Bryobacteraceae bacterium]|jgi:SAM-dependent methyltransferase
MDEILSSLRPGMLVLDLGSSKGSFARDATLATTVRVDREVPSELAGQGLIIEADAAALPFADGCFAAVIMNHSLEHFDDLAGALREVGRIVRADGSVFVAVPDASTFTDRLYRWLARGGGHVNAFVSARETAAEIERAIGLPLVATKLLYSSLSFLNRRNAPRPLPRRLLILGAGYEWSLFLYIWLSRKIDRWLNTRTAIYGWAFYFGRFESPVDTTPWPNMCIRCGRGASASFLASQSLISRRWWGPNTFRCAHCGATNPFVDDARGG